MWDKLDAPQIYFYRWIAAAFAHAGLEERAQAAATHYLNTYPNFDLKDHLDRMPFRLEADLAHYGEGLSRAGLGKDARYAVV